MNDQPNLDQGKATQPINLHSAHQGMIPAGGIAVYIGASVIPVIHVIAERATLGRRYDAADATLIDLMPYDAFRYGVSRVHCILMFEQGRLFVRDEGSMNGTWVSGTRLAPNATAPIQSGATVMCGQMPITIYYNRVGFDAL